jgi:hypothetical protein
MVVTPKKTSPCDWPGGLPKAADRWTISLNVCSAGQRFSSIPIHRRGASGFLVCPAPDAPHRRAPRRRPGSHPQQQTQAVRNIMVFLHVCSARAFPRQSAKVERSRFGPQPVTSGLLQTTDIVWPPRWSVLCSADLHNTPEELTCRRQQPRAPPPYSSSCRNTDRNALSGKAQGWSSRRMDSIARAEQPCGRGALP